MKKLIMTDEEGWLRRMVEAVDVDIDERLAPIVEYLKRIEELVLDIKDPLRHIPIPPRCEACDYCKKRIRECGKLGWCFSEIGRFATLTSCGRTVNGERIEWEEK